MTILASGPFGAGECGCALAEVDGDMLIEYCALHDSAPDMFETLRRIEALCETILAADADATYINVILVVARDSMTRAAKRGN